MYIIKYNTSGFVKHHINIVVVNLDLQNSPLKNILDMESPLLYYYIVSFDHELCVFATDT